MGGLEGGVRGRQAETEDLVVIAAQEDGAGIGRIRMRRIAGASAPSLESFIAENIARGSVIHTDGRPGYGGVAARGYVHKVTVLTGKKQSASELMPLVRIGGSLLYHRGEDEQRSFDSTCRKLRGFLTEPARQRSPSPRNSPDEASFFW